jgi:hypothetical protein
MLSNTLQAVADTVGRRAQRQGYVVPREIREELASAGVPEARWKDVLALTHPALRLRNGRYYYPSPVSERVRKEQHAQRLIHRAARQIIRLYKDAAQRVERREQERVAFVQPVTVTTEDERELTLLSRDISPTGIRLIGTRSFLGQKVRVEIPQVDDTGPWCFLVRILWTCAVGDELFENGGQFLEVVPAEGS